MGIKSRILQLADPFIRLPAFGLDISDRSVKYLMFSVNGGVEIAAWGEFALPEGAVVHGEIKKPEEVGRLLSGWFLKEKKRLGTEYVTVSLPEEKSFLRMVQAPKMSKEDLVGFIPREIEAHVPLRPEEMVYDYEVVEPLADSLDHLDAVVTVFPKAVVHSYLQALFSAGLKPAALELESQALARALIPDPREAGAKIAVDFGRTRTTLAVFAGGAIIFTRTLDIGGEVLEENIVKSLGVGAIEAGKLKFEAGLDKRVRNGELFSALIPGVAALADEILRVIEYYRLHVSHAHGASAAIQELLLVGGDANLRGLDTYLESKFKIPVTRADPFAAIRKGAAHDVLPIRRSTALGYATAAGLALRELMPYHTKFRRRET